MADQESMVYKIVDKLFYALVARTIADLIWKAIQKEKEIAGHEQREGGSRTRTTTSPGK